MSLHIASHRVAQGSISCNRHGRRFFRKDPMSQPPHSGRRETQSTDQDEDIDGDGAPTPEDTPVTNNHNKNNTSDKAKSSDKPWIKRHQPS